MSEIQQAQGESTPGRGPILIAALLALVALGVSGYLSVQTLTGNPVAGCGGDAGCGAVLASPWSKLGPLPVSLLGAATYLAVLVGLGLRVSSGGKSALADFALLASAPALLVAAGWFTYVQLVEIQEVCPYCMVDHGIGVVLAILLPVIVLGHCRIKPAAPLAVGLVAVLLMIGAQLSAPGNADTGSAENLFVDRDGDKTLDGRRHLSLFGGELQRVMQDQPYLGDPAADQVVGLVFDYACPHCRALHELMDQAMRDKPKRFALLPLPVTIDERYNPHVQSDNERFDESYELAKLSLAVAAIDRDKWAGYDRWLFSPETITQFPRSAEEARAKAIELVGEAALDAQLTGEALAAHEATIKRNIELLSLLPADQQYIPVVTAPGAPRHLTERFYDIAVLEKLLDEADAGLKKAEPAPQ